MAKKKQKKADSAADATPDPKISRGSKSAWKMMDRGSSVAAALLARKVSTLTWQAATGRKPPSSDRHPDVDAREAVAWAVVGGALVELVRVLVRRSTASYYVKSTGHLPPGLKPLDTAEAAKADEEPLPSDSAKGRKSRKSRRKR